MVVKMCRSILSRASIQESKYLAERTIDWTGISGEKYNYQIYPLGTEFSNVPGNYVFARENESRRFTPIYIGQTSNLGERFDTHHKIPCIRRYGATHICVHKSSSNESVRMAEEQDLIKKWNLPCNY